MQQKTKANAGRLDKSRRSQPRENAERLLLILKRKLTCDEAGTPQTLHITYTAVRVNILKYPIKTIFKRLKICLTSI